MAQRKLLVFFLAFIIILSLIKNISPVFVRLKNSKPAVFVKQNADSDSKEVDDDWEEDIDEIEDDKVFTCRKCQGGKYCDNLFIQFGIRTETVTCQAGEICWKANSPNGTYRGCGTRECLMSPGQFGANSKIDETFFEDNMCCIENKCNKGSTHFYLPSYLLLSKVLLTVLVVKLF